MDQTLTAQSPCPLHRVVEGIAELTRQKDLLSLESRLFTLIGEIWPQVECWLAKTPWDDYPTRENLIIHGDRASIPLDLALLALQLKGRENLDQRERGGHYYISGHIPQPDDEESELLLLASPQPLGDDALQLLTSLLHVYRNHLDLLQAGDRDLLTGTQSRKLLQNRMTDQLAARLRGRRYRQEGNADYLVLLNLDGFSRINERHGHLVADRVLQQAARCLRDTLHEDDMLFRRAGDEFAVLLFDISPEMIVEICERLHAAIAACPFVADIRLTASLGYRDMRHDHLPQEIIDHAVAALAYAKDHGRDQVQDYAGLAAAGLVQGDGAERSVELF